MRYAAQTVIISAIFCQALALGYTCDKGTCPAAYGISYKCCNPHITSGICCPRDGTCCYHGTSNQCCKPAESCCWDKWDNDVTCCPEGTVCCPNRKRGTCCFKTPAFFWIILGLCGSIIVILLLLSLYQCVHEECVEYTSQKAAGDLPSDNSWYYNYGSTRSGPALRAPPSYEPPPSYSSHSNTRGNHSNTNSSAENSNNRPKPPTSQNNALNNVTGPASRGTEYHSSMQDRESQFDSTISEFHSIASEQQTDRQLSPDQDELRTLYFYEPTLHTTDYTLQRMRCSEYQCLVDDESCVYCSDQEDLPDLNETSDLEPEENVPNRSVQNSKTTQLSDKDLSKSTFLQQKQIPENLLKPHNQRTVLH